MAQGDGGLQKQTAIIKVLHDSSTPAAGSLRERMYAAGLVQSP